MAEWRFLKTQANGETRGSDDYDEVYQGVLREFEKAEANKAHAEVQASEK